MRLRLTVFLLLALGVAAFAPLQSQGTAQAPAPALGDRARDVERRLAVIPGHESAKATVRFPFQGNIPATQRGRGYDPTVDLARSESVLKSLESGSGPAPARQGRHQTSPLLRTGRRDPALPRRGAD